MDKITLDNTRDLPMTTNTLAFMQASYKMFEQLGFLGGENVIVSGCDVTGSSAAQGYMYLKGQLMPFLGGVIQTNVRIVTVVTNIDVDAGVRQQTSYRAEFGTSANPEENVAWADITKLDSLKTLMAQLVINAGLISGNASDIATNAAAILVNANAIAALQGETINWGDGSLEGGNHGANSFIRCAKLGNVIYIHGDIQTPNQPAEDDVLFSLPNTFPNFTEAMHFAAVGAEPTENYELKLAAGTRNVVSGAGQSSDSTASFSLAIPII